jgi:hypothetical protein
MLYLFLRGKGFLWARVLASQPSPLPLRAYRYWVAVLIQLQQLAEKRLVDGLVACEMEGKSVIDKV